jgi:hypothetical protein
MLFVSAELSRREEVSDIFKIISDGTQKSDPNGNMSLFIPIGNVTKATPEFRLKIIFNHDKHIGDETLFCIGGFNDLNTHITLKNDKSIPLHILLKSIPASEGMSRPQLFTQVEPNPAAMVTIVTYQARDHNLVSARKATLESEIRNIIKDGEAGKVFIDDTEGIWFGGLNNPKYGRHFDSTNTNRDAIAYSSHINKVMSSPPKKRILNQPKWGGGIPATPIDGTPTKKCSSSTAPKSGPTIPVPSVNAIDNHFEMIRVEINNQREINTQFNNRIGSLELTTKQIDFKLDRLLDHMENSSSIHKIQKTSNVTFQEPSSLPGHPSFHHKTQGSSSQCPL